MVLTNSTTSVKMFKSQNSCERANSTRQPSLDNSSTKHTIPEPDLYAEYSAPFSPSGSKHIPQLTAVNFKSKPHHGTAPQRHEEEEEDVFAHYEGCNMDELITSEKRPSLKPKPSVYPKVLGQQTKLELIPE